VESRYLLFIDGKPLGVCLVRRLGGIIRRCLPFPADNHTGQKQPLPSFLTVFHDHGIQFSPIYRGSVDLSILNLVEYKEEEKGVEL
jgi:hypothetical protein